MSAAARSFAKARRRLTARVLRDPGFEHVRGDSILFIPNTLNLLPRPGCEGFFIAGGAFHSLDSASLGTKRSLVAACLLLSLPSSWSLCVWAFLSVSALLSGGLLFGFRAATAIVLVSADGKMEALPPMDPSSSLWPSILGAAIFLLSLAPCALWLHETLLHPPSVGIEPGALSAHEKLELLAGNSEMS